MQTIVQTTDEQGVDRGGKYQGTKEFIYILYFYTDKTLRNEERYRQNIY